VNRRRFLAVAAVLFLGGAVVFARSLQVTVFEHDAWSEQANKQQRQVIQVQGPRGTIRTADGYILATSVERVAIQVDTSNLEYPELFARAAAALLVTSEAELMRRFSEGPRSLWLAKMVPPEVAEEVRLLAVRAVALVPDFARIYPQQRLAAPVVGFVGREELNTIGRSGFEHHYDAYLAGEPEAYLAVNDAIRRKVRLEKLSSGRAGYDLELSLNARLQARCEAALADGIHRHGAKAGSAVVVDPWTGRVLALASLPSFDPSSPGSSPSANWRLRPVQDALEPGSTVKPVIAAAALSGGVVREGELFDCTDRGTRVAGHWVRDHADPGMYTLDEVVVYSANVGIILAAERVPDKMLWNAFAAFGFGRRSGIDFPAEARGLMPETRTWSKMSSAGFALGQELTVSPLQMAMAYAAIANGGWLRRPVLVRSDTGDARTGSDAGATRVLEERMARRLRIMLEGVVVEGTGKLAAVPGYSVAGKTGTAQRAENGSYDDDQHTSWFAGFLPATDPRLVIVVAIEDPAERDYWASTVAAPVFAEIAAAAVTILDIPPTVVEEDADPKVASNPFAAAGGNA
jgi:cell division protein FtsI (penicillin-binding protein 3)